MNSVSTRTAPARTGVHCSVPGATKMQSRNTAGEISIFRKNERNQLWFPQPDFQEYANFTS